MYQGASILRSAVITVALPCLPLAIAQAQPAATATVTLPSPFAPRTVDAPAPAGPETPFPPPPPRGNARTVSAAFGMGLGLLALEDQYGRDGQRASSFLGRLGVAVAPDWVVVLGVERAATERGGSTFSQTAASLGLQRFLGRMYVGAALAAGWVGQSGEGTSLIDGPGGGGSLMLGAEPIRSDHAALTVELSYTRVVYRYEAWDMGGVRVGVVVF